MRGRGWVWWTAFVSALVLVAQVPAQAVDNPPTTTTTPADTPTTTPAPAPVEPCAATPDTDPPIWEQTLPIEQVSSQLSATDPACLSVVERTPDSVVWRAPDGQLTARSYSGPVNYQSSDGSWQAIDTRLVPDGHGGEVNKAGPFSVDLAGSAAAPSLVQLDTGSGSGSVSFGLDGLASTDGSVVAPAADATGEVSGDGADTVTYASAFPGVDVHYQVLTTGVKEAIVLNQPLSATTKPEFRFSVTTKDGLHAQTADDGTIQFVDAKGTAEFVVPAGGAIDAAGATTPVSFTLVTSADPDVSELIVSIDPAWLSDPARVFPVTVDPTLTHPVTDGNTAEDAYVANGSADVNTNYQGWGQFDFTLDEFVDNAGIKSGACRQIRQAATRTKPTSSPTPPTAAPRMLPVKTRRSTRAFRASESQPRNLAVPLLPYPPSM